jgi:hypothetical protein
MIQFTIPRRRDRRLAVALAALAVGLCGAAASTASASVPDLQAPSDASSVWDSSTAKSVTAFCPARTHVIGTGAKISGGSGQVLLESVVPNAQLTSVTVSAHEDADGAPGIWSVTATAICANVPGLERVSKVSTSGSDDTKTASALCPSGKKSLGAGGEITGGNGHVYLMWIEPSTVDGGAEAQVARGGASNSWSLTAYGICADPPPGYELVWKYADTGSATSFGLAVSCSPGKRLLGTGGMVGSGGQIGMTAMTPQSSPSQGAVVAGYEDQYGSSFTWSLVAYAICATP